MGFYTTVETTLKPCRELMTEVFFGREKIFSAKVIVLHAALILMSFAFVYVFSYSTSFRYDFLGGDSSIFQSVGKYWAQGYLPYVDLFEHKGALLFLFNALGYVIYPRVGVMVPQIICLYLSCLFIWRAMELYSSSAWKIFFMLLTLIYYAAHYQEGNHPTEYSVLFLSAAAYCFLRALKASEGKKFFHPPLYGFIYGFGFGACFLIRLSDAAQICCQTFLAAIFLLQARDFRNLRQNVLSFCAGFAIILLPFVIYFAAHGALYEFFFGTILFNLKYTALPLQPFPPITLAIYYGVHFMPFWILIAASLLKISSDRRSRLAWSGLFCGAAILFMLTNFRLFRHYCTIFLPLTPLFFAVLVEFVPIVNDWFFREKIFLRKLVHGVLILLIALYLILCQKRYIEPFALYLSAADVAEIQKQDLVGVISLLPQKFTTPYDFSDDKNFSSVKDLAKMIPVAERNSVVTWGYYCTTPHWVLETNIKPRERLFFLNATFGKIDPAFREEWFGNVRANPPLWILYGVTCEKNSDVELNIFDSDDELEQLLAEKYSLKGETFIFPQVMKLYRLKE